MRILLVTHYYSTHKGGIEIVAGRLASILAAQHEVVWCASDCDPVPADLPDSVRCVPMRSANAIERVSGLPFPLWGPGSLLRLWRETGAADVVHLHDFAYMGNCAAFMFAALRGKRVLITQHVGFIPYRNPLLRFLLRAVHATAGRFMLRRADRTVFVSRLVRDYFVQFVRFRRPPLVIANGVDVSTFVPPARGDQARAKASLGLDPARPVLLFIGRFVEKKGLHVLEQITRRMTDVSWVFAGWGPIDPRRWNAPHVHVVEGRRGPDLVPLYHAADLLVLPSVGEGLPLVVQEAMSCGTPVLVGDDTADTVDAPTGLVFGCPVGGADTAANWDSAIRRSLAATTPDLRRAVAEFARTRWSWTRCGAEYAELLAAAAEDQRRR